MKKLLILVSFVVVFLFVTTSFASGVFGTHWGQDRKEVTAMMNKKYGGDNPEKRSWKTPFLGNEETVFFSFEDSKLVEIKYIFDFNRNFHTRLGKALTQKYGRGVDTPKGILWTTKTTEIRLYPELNAWKTGYYLILTYSPKIKQGKTEL